MAKNKNTETIDKAVELTQDAAKATLTAGVKSAEVAEEYVQGMYKVGYETNVEAMKVAKNYWDATSQIRQDWLKLFAQTGEYLIDASAKMELPLQKEVADFGRGIVNNVQQTVENLTAQAKTAGK